MNQAANLPKLDVAIVGASDYLALADFDHRNT